MPVPEYGHLFPVLVYSLWLMMLVQSSESHTLRCLLYLTLAYAGRKATLKRDLQKG